MPSPITKKPSGSGGERIPLSSRSRIILSLLCPTMLVLTLARNRKKTISTSALTLEHGGVVCTYIVCHHAQNGAGDERGALPVAVENNNIRSSSPTEKRPKATREEKESVHIVVTCLPSHFLGLLAEMVSAYIIHLSMITCVLSARGTALYRHTHGKRTRKKE